MRTLVRMSVLALCLLLAGFQAGWAGTPQRFTVQGILEDGSSNPVADGPYSLILTGWDDSTGGVLLWTENKLVQTSNGLFTTALDGAGVAGVLSHSGQQYIQIQVSGQAPLSPRIRLSSVPSALLSTRMDGDVRTQPGSLTVHPGAGDPDFDLLRLSATDSGATVRLSGGDPDFDLLRITANPQTSSIKMAGGDPDFDLLRITADATSSSMAMNSITGDPDFDLLRITATDSTAKIAISHGDPDFDLLRITGNPTGSSMTLNGTGDPDFDLLRVSAAATTGSITVGSGDPDFDLLRITGSPAASSVVLNPGSGDPDFDLLRIVADNSGGSIAIDEEGVQRVHVTGGNGAAALSLNGLPPGSPVGGLITMTADSTGGDIAIDEEGVQFVKLHGGGSGGGGGGSIAVNEEGTHNFSVAMSADSGGGSFAMSEGNTFRCQMDNEPAVARLSLNGLPPGSPVGGLITMTADSTGGEIAIDEEGVQRLREKASHGGVVIVLDGYSSSAVQGGKITTSVDSTGSTMTSEFNGVPGARLTVKGSRRTYNFFEAWPCGVRDVEVGTQGVTMSCTPGGTTTPDTAVQIDPEGHMTLAGDLSVGGDICAVGTIGACSDARYKTDVTQLEGALAQLDRIRGVNFSWRTDEFPDKNFRTGRDFGFIAQELKEVVPQVVTLGKDGYYSVDYGRLTPILVEAVKELEAKTRQIDDLEARLARLEALLATAGGTSEGTVANR